MNRYTPNDKLTRLKMELAETENELECAPEHRKERIENHINNIQESIRQEEEIIEKMCHDEDE